MLETIKRHLISAAVTFVSTIWVFILTAVLQLDPNIAWKTYLEAGSIAWFVLVVWRAFVKILFESLIPAIQSAVPYLMDLFKSVIEWAKNLNNSNTKQN